jgi:AraC-like DNA-binding protein
VKGDAVCEMVEPRANLVAMVNFAAVEDRGWPGEANSAQFIALRVSIDAMKAIALANGFWHMGEFRTLYRDLFGETPQQTCVASRGRDGG